LRSGGVLGLSRPLNTGDSQDFQFECDNVYDFQWVANTRTSNVNSKHTDAGSWTMIIDDDCNVNVLGVSLYMYEGDDYNYKYDGEFYDNNDNFKMVYDEVSGDWIPISWETYDQEWADWY
jgi:hypothetical protein